MSECVCMRDDITILKSRSIFSSTDAAAFEGVVVLRGRRIAAVGPEEIAAKYAGAKIVDYGDCTILPAFSDSHLHLLVGAINEKSGSLRDASSEEEAAHQFFSQNRTDRGTGWLLGGAWDHFRWPGGKLPAADSLDKYFPNRPVFLLSKEGHGGWVNTAALRHFGIERDTPDPAYGAYFRNPVGNPTGYLHESAGMRMLMRILAELDMGSLGAYVDWFMNGALEYGICSVTDMQIGGISPYELFDSMEKDGRLRMRIHYCPPLNLPIQKHLALRKKHQGERLRYSGAKDFMDGTPMGHSGLMVKPYTDMPDRYGAPLADLDAVEAQVIALDAAGVRSRLHACGDLAAKLALDYFEKARSINGTTGVRHAIEHLEVMDPADIPRFGRLDVVAAVQPDHLPKYDFYNHPFHSIIGSERMRYAWPFKSLLNSGAVLGFGTDYPVAPLNPARGLYRAVTRLTDEREPQGGFNPNEKLSLAEALRAYTAGSAYLNMRENELGTLEPGKMADVIVLDRDIFGVKPEDLIRIRTAATWFDGIKVFER